MTFLTNLGVKETCLFRLVLERKADKETPESSTLQFLERFSANNFALSDAEDTTSGLLCKNIVDLPLLRTLTAIHEKSLNPGFWQIILFWFISISMFGSFKNHFAIITSLYKLHFR